MLHDEAALREVEAWSPNVLIEYCGYARTKSATNNAHTTKQIHKPIKP